MRACKLSVQIIGYLRKTQYVDDTIMNLYKIIIIICSLLNTCVISGWLYPSYSTCQYSLPPRDHVNWKISADLWKTVNISDKLNSHSYGKGLIPLPSFYGILVTWPIFFNRRDPLYRRSEMDDLINLVVEKKYLITLLLILKRKKIPFHRGTGIFNWLLNILSSLQFRSCEDNITLEM